MSDDVKRLLAPLARSLRARNQSVTRLVTERILQEVPTLCENDAPNNALTEAVRANTLAILHAAEFGVDPSRMPIPEDALASVRRLAHRATPLPELLRAYPVGQSALVELIQDTARQVCHDPEDEALLSLRFTSIVFAYLDHLAVESASVYGAERSAMHQEETGLRQELDAVRRLLEPPVAGTGTDNTGTMSADTVGAGLPYPLDARHLGVVLWAAAGPLRSETDAERLILRLSEHLGCSGPPLLAAPDESTLWAWLQNPRREPSPDALPAGMPPEGHLLSIGETSSGRDGFRFTHRRAIQARALATLNPTPKKRALMASHLGPLAIMAHHLPDLRQWVRHVLSGLAHDDENTARLRETLLAYLRNDGSLAGAAMELHLHRNTVQYRIRQAEAMIGERPDARRRDLELALLACDVLGPAVLAPPPEDH